MSHEINFTLSDEVGVELNEMRIKDMPPEAPSLPSEFIKWLMEHNADQRIRQKLLNHISHLPTETLKIIFDSNCT